jgi:hypothetical protein
MTPKVVAMLLQEYRVKWLGAPISKRTTVQIECPHIIGDLSANPTTEDEELGTDHGCGMVATTAGTGTIDLNVVPLSRYWSASYV